MPTKDFQEFYRGLNDAITQLYHNGALTLAAGANRVDTDFDSEVFERAAEWIRKEGKFNASMMKDQPVRDLIAETFRVLDGAITCSVSEEMPDDLVGLLENNAFTFSGFKTYHSLNEVGLSLVDKTGGIKPFEKFREDVAKIDDKYNRNYLQAEYNHAVASAQMASKWHEYEQDGDRYNLQYRTAGDSLVREEHALLHNTTLPIGDPFWAQYTPPNGWNCRCTIVQVLKGKYPESDREKAVEAGDKITADPKQKMFRFNPGKEMKIFPDKHPYNKTPKEVKEAVQSLARERDNALRKQTDAKVREWFKKDVQNKSVVISNAFETGEMKLSSDSIKHYLHHARTNEAKWMLKNVLDRPHEMKFVEFSPLGATKNTRGNPVDAKNVAKKAKRHVAGYNVYEFRHRDTTWIIGLEKVNRDGGAFEQPYYIKKQKP